MRPVQQENLIPIRIGGRDPGKHILAKEHVVRVSGEPFTFSVLLAMVVVTIFRQGWTVSSVLGLAPNSLKGTLT
jgi:hypothetical protein